MKAKTCHSFIVCGLFCLNFGKDFDYSAHATVIKFEMINMVMNFGLCTEGAILDTLRMYCMLSV